MVDQGRWSAAWGCHLQEAEREVGKCGDGKGGDRGKDGVGMGDGVIAAEAGVDFGGILHSLQVVCDGDDGKENEDENGDGYPLGSPGRTGLRCEAQPEANDQDGRQGPCEIEG